MKKILLAGAMLVVALPAFAGIVYDSTNAYSLTNCTISGACGDPNPAANTFTLAQDTFIHTVEGFFQTTNGLGTDVSLVDLGLTGANGTVSATAVSDPNGYFFGFHQVTTLDQWFAAGDYTVYASNVTQWGFNGTSGGKGLAVVTDAPAPDAPEPATWSMIAAGALALGYRARSRRA